MNNSNVTTRHANYVKSHGLEEVILVFCIYIYLVYLLIK